jgi:hypothetical protein
LPWFTTKLPRYSSAFRSGKAASKSASHGR